ncbi:glycoside hydrolase family 43 protein [Sphingobacterium corticibacterium]|uniref:Carbohydrate-binding protein n=1 Tax=Sphingobacterium corticibacterium TaxID=2484746 RepID=A0A4Q6XJ26_9SPHI|nr:glycoside hydrolase family 43 protein [Sphingobacterium corticibacterium]RZF59295.1 carbohydrate-binding protein [Sphingobacterium corticibacterium]
MKVFGTLIMSLVGFALHAQNPIVQTNFTPDPAPMVYNDRVYMYAGDDIPGYDFYYMTKWRVYSSADMVNWTDHGAPISLESFSWARDRAWAAQCVERDGKFYWYICAQTIDNNMAIGVAVADSPTGPFKDALGKPLITTGSWSNIDPTAFVDDDGQAYLYWGNAKLFYVKLNKDMISYSEEIVEVPQTVESFGGLRRPGKSHEVLQKDEQYEDVFVEGPWIYKRDKKYYLLYAGMTQGTECLSYAISDTPTGPWRYQSKIMTDEPTNSFTNHGGIIDFKGKSYLFYHTGLLPGGGSYGRSSAVEEFTYGENGEIPKISISKGVKPLSTINPYERNEAETIAWSEKCSTDEDSEVGVYVSKIRSGGFIKVQSVDFGQVGPTGFAASVAAGLDGGVLEVRLDSVAGLKISSIDIPRTGGWNSWKTIESKIVENVRGLHDVYFVFQGQNLTAGRELFNFDFWSFEK